MAKKSVRQCELKKQRLEEKYRAKYQAIKNDLGACYAALENGTGNEEEVFAKIDALQQQLQQIPRNATKKRKRNRCELTGRPRGFYRKFKLSRNMLRKLAMAGLIPGLRKASW
ncbi:MAG: 30S ribosomal protein S14 [Legionellales bacterium]|nr:30S ribosomal protein S14 [Legionellales bacterium]|tara:strand:+ start:1485 stop:1823 length:339 start_codon:yes stop_codon:yes gene_type:complete